MQASRVIGRRETDRRVIDRRVIDRRVVGRRVASLLATVSLAVVLVACDPTVSPQDPSFGAALLTPDGDDHYALTAADGVVTAATPSTNTGGNTRVAFWPAADPVSVDQQSCATWADPRGEIEQRGAALRVRSAGGHTTALTVTNNIFFYGRWGFNVHVMDTAADPAFRWLASFDLSGVFRPGGPGSYAALPYPWRMCTRVVGDTLSFLVWPLKHRQPDWGDPRYGGSVRLPAGWERAGHPGWYVGHLRPGESVGFTDLTTTAIRPLRSLP